MNRRFGSTQSVNVGCPKLRTRAVDFHIIHTTSSYDLRIASSDTDSEKLEIFRVLLSWSQTFDLPKIVSILNN